MCSLMGKEVEGIIYIINTIISKPINYDFFTLWTIQEADYTSNVEWSERALRSLGDTSGCSDLSVSFHSRKI